MFAKIESEYKQKLKSQESGNDAKQRLESKINAQQQEIQIIQKQMSEKDQKLKTQIQKNHDLLGELQELSEAVHALKNDKAFQRSTEIIEEKEEVIHQLQSFLLENVKKHLETQYTVMSKAQ